MQKKYKMIDLFAGCGGLTEGFMDTKCYSEIAAVEWLKPQVDTLRNRLKTKWNEKDAEQRAMHFDIQREDELFAGWNDNVFGIGLGLDYFVNNCNGIDVIIGGPPCQAYSVAGRVRDENNMQQDYRNYLFEHYLNVVDRYKPTLFVFENVPGILSAAPNGTPITTLIKQGFESIGYDIIDDIGTYALVNASDYGVAQNRTRVIIVGLRKTKFEKTQDILKTFYTTILPKYKSNKAITVKEKIGDLPKCLPLFDEENHRKRISHTTPECKVSGHVPRYANLRDMDTFRILAEDIETGKREFDSRKISELYEKKSAPNHLFIVIMC